MITIPGVVLTFVFIPIPNDRTPDPVLQDLLVFPTPYEISMERWKTAKAHVEWLKGLRAITSFADTFVLEERIAEAAGLMDVWGYLADAQNTSYSDWSRLYNLWELKCALGEAHYYSGIMPCHLPIWRFRVME